MTTPRENLTVLLVDDDERLLRGLVRGLAPFGYHVLTAISVAEAGVHLSREAIDVVVSDHRMPGITGLTFLQALQDQYPAIRRIILSGTVDAYAGWDLHRYAHGVLAKPCDANRLHEEISNVLSGSAQAAKN